MTGDFIHYRKVGRIERTPDGGLAVTFAGTFGGEEHLAVTATAARDLLRHRAGADLLQVQPGCAPVKAGKAYRSRSGGALILTAATVNDTMMCPWTALQKVASGLTRYAVLSVQVVVPFQTAPARVLEV